MAPKRFDRKFGPGFLQTVPSSPGVYFLHDENGTIFYVGKAKCLRRRLAQYRNAKRLKRDRKMVSLVKRAVSIRWEVCESELDASLLEIRLIQRHRPEGNVSGVFSFLYPLVGLRFDGEPRVARFVLTTVPARFPDCRFFGAFRSREVTAEAFFALMRLLKYVGHPVPRRELGPDEAYSYRFGFRRLPEEWGGLWERFFRGESPEALETLALRLLDNAGARRNAAEVEDDLAALKVFWKHEARALREAIEATGYEAYPVPQEERDPLFLRSRAK